MRNTNKFACFAAGVILAAVAHHNAYTVDYADERLIQVEGLTQSLRETVQAPIKAARAIQDWWINRSAYRRAARSARTLEDAHRGVDRYDILEPLEEDDLVVEVEAEPPVVQPPPLPDAAAPPGVAAEVAVVIAAPRPRFQPGERVVELASAARVQFGQVKNNEANVEVVRRFMSRHPLVSGATIRYSQRAQLVERAVIDYFLVRSSDMVQALVISSSRNRNREAQRVSPRS
jgi:hypothetical protein